MGPLTRRAAVETKLDNKYFRTATEILKNINGLCLLSLSLSLSLSLFINDMLFLFIIQPEWLIIWILFLSPDNN